MAVAEPFLTLHPDSKKQGVRIEKAKYDVMRTAILENLQRHGAMTFSRLGALIEDLMQGNFDGSVMWYYTTVKLDLEARGEVRRVPGSKPQLIEAC
ncbi:hypothetical protein ANAEL_01265 [Anaerolineales bacterium]|nr:hypothetical protein ANAEL_01265 [Anaerolineales bacterium]